MARQSISLTEPNDEWLKRQVDSNEYSSKSEIVNELIRQARKQQQQVDWLRRKIQAAEDSGFTNDTKEEIRRAAHERLNGEV
jgi:antitoxin ParD1/3/4